MGLSPERPRREPATDTASIAVDAALGPVQEESRIPYYAETDLGFVALAKRTVGQVLADVSG